MPFTGAAAATTTFASRTVTIDGTAQENQGVFQLGWSYAILVAGDNVIANAKTLHSIKNIDVNPQAIDIKVYDSNIGGGAGQIIDELQANDLTNEAVFAGENGLALTTGLVVNCSAAPGGNGIRVQYRTF